MWTALIALAILPWLFEYLPLLDYANWLAEAHIISNLLDPESQYDAVWRLHLVPTPNIAVPLLLALLSRFMSVGTAGKLIVSGYLLTFPIALSALARLSSGKEHTALLLATVWTFNIFFFSGFISYLWSLVFAFIGLILLEKWRSYPRTKTLLLLSIVSTICYFTHLIGYVVLIVTLMAYLAQSLKLREPVRRNPLLLLISQLPALLSLLVYTFSRLNHGQVPLVFYDSLPNKLFSFVEPFFTVVRFDPVVAFSYTTVLNGIVIGLILILLIRYRGKVTFSHTFYAALLLILLATAMPFSWFAGMVRPDERLFFPGVLLFLASIELKIDFSQITRYVASLIILLVVITALLFVAVQPAFRQIEATAEEFLETGTAITVVAIMRPPISSACTPRAGNFASVGLFPILRAPFYAALDGTTVVKLPLFESGLVRQKDGPQKTTISLNSIKMVQRPSINALFEGQSDVEDLFVGPGHAVMVLGCQNDLDLLDARINQGIQDVTDTSASQFLRAYRSNERLRFLDFTSHSLLNSRH